MKVLLVNDRPLEAGGGAEVYVHRLAAALAEHGDDVALFAGEVLHHGWRKVRDLWDPAARRAVADRARMVGADVVHLHNVLRELSPAVLGAVPDVPTVLTVHDHRLVGVADDGTPRLRRWVDTLLAPAHRRLVRRHVAVVVAVSEPLAEALAGVLGDACVVTHVPAAVPLPVAPTPPPSASTDVVFVGRVDRDKGIGVLADAFARLAPEHPDSHLVVVGDGPDVDRVRQLAPRVRVCGRLAWPEVSSALGAARVVAVPSTRPEGMPLVALEAAMHGRPVVASDDPGLRHAVTALQAGALVPPGDVTALAAALDRFLGDPGHADAVGAAAAAAARARHHPARVARRTRDVYARATAR